MQEDFDEKAGYSRRRQEDFLRGGGTLDPVLQSGDTLRPGYDWVGHFEALHPGYRFLEHDDTPWTPFDQSLLEATVALVTTSGVHLKTHKPFSVLPGEVTPFLLRHRFKEQGDPSLRIIPATSSTDGLEVAHAHLDVSGAAEDINVVFPLDRLRELEEESFIGAVAPRHLSLSGFLPRVEDLEEAVEQVVEILHQDGVDAVLLSPGEVLSHQTMGQVQRAVEASGIPTVGVVLCRDVARRIRIPRSVHYRFPFGYTFGDANDEAMQLRILKDALRALEEIDEPGRILDLPYEWVQE